MENHNEQEEATYRSLREYSRVDGHLPIQISLVPTEEHALMRSRTSLEAALTENQEMPEPQDRVIAECLRILNTKLDTIIRMLAFQTRDYSSLRLEEVNISAGGLSTSTRETFECGDLVEIRFMLPTASYVIFYVYGKVVKSEPECDSHRIWIYFTLIDEDIREQIVKYVFERQREILRKQRRQ
ncbi:MAG: PilZ domain-containing protein [Syntrophobacteraceae bacterium]